MSYTRLRYHIITATKHREMIITPDVEVLVYSALQAKALKIGGRLLQIGGVEDHVHMVAAFPPSIALATFVRELKAASSHVVNKAGLVEGRFEWQRGYGAFTLNPLDLSTVLHYVANQKQHHAEGELWASYERWEE